MILPIKSGNTCENSVLRRCIMKSIWETEKIRKFPSLEGDIKTDVAIIGGGLAGILTAYCLKKSGVDCVLLEKGRVLSGNSGRTTAKITCQHGLIYDKIIKKYGIEAGEKYFAANNEALGEYKKLAKEIECDFEIKDAYVYTTEDPEKIEREYNAYNIIGIKGEMCQALPLPVEAKAALKVCSQAQFDPAKFASAITENLNIFENTFVERITAKSLCTDKGSVSADKIVVATHFPILNKFGYYFVKMYQHRSYAIAVSGASDVDGMYVSESDTGLSFRNHKGLLMITGGGGRTGKKCREWSYLREFAKKHYPDSSEEYFWAAQDCMTLDGIPYIGRYSKTAEDLLVETGFNKWGMTGSMVAAKIVSGMINGKVPEYADVFAPSRTMLSKQLIINGFEAVHELLTPSKHVCPHLGCALKWNKSEHSWDCPCHGSRFDDDGRLLDNPATKNLNMKQ